jgi:hypothetical protein
MGGVAFAQSQDTTNSTTQSPNENTEADAIFLGNKDKMSVFFTDDSMMTLRADEELRSAWMALTPEDQTAFRTDCEALTKGGGGEPSAADPQSPSNAELCGKISAY